jgi:hypothetical protein
MTFFAIGRARRARMRHSCARRDRHHRGALLVPIDATAVQRSSSSARAAHMHIEMHGIQLAQRRYAPRFVNHSIHAMNANVCDDVAKRNTKLQRMRDMSLRDVGQFDPALHVVGDRNECARIGFTWF